MDYQKPIIYDILNSDTLQHIGVDSGLQGLVDELLPRLKQEIFVLPKVSGPFRKNALILTFRNGRLGMIPPLLQDI